MIGYHGLGTAVNCLVTSMLDGARCGKPTHWDNCEKSGMGKACLPVILVKLEDIQYKKT